MHPEKGLPEALQVPAVRIREKKDLLHKAAERRVRNARRLQSEIRRAEEVRGEAVHPAGSREVLPILSHRIRAGQIKERKGLLHKAAGRRVRNARHLQSEIHRAGADHLTEGSGIGIPIGTATHREAAEAVIVRLRKVNRRLSRLYSKGKRTACRKSRIRQYLLYLKNANRTC